MVHILFMFLAIFLQIEKQVALIADRLVVRKVIEDLTMGRASILKLWTRLLPPKMEDRVVYFMNILLVGDHPSLLLSIFYISSTLFPSPRR